MTQSPTRLPAEALTDEQLDAALEATLCEGDSILAHMYYGLKGDDDQIGRIMAREILRTAYAALPANAPVEDRKYTQAEMEEFARACIKSHDERLANAPVAQPTEKDAWVRGEEDADGNELVTVRKDEWERLKAAEPVAQPAGAVPDRWETLVTGEWVRISADMVQGLKDKGYSVRALYVAPTHSPEPADTLIDACAMACIGEQVFIDPMAPVESDEAYNRACVDCAAAVRALAAPPHVPENSGGDGVVRARAIQECMDVCQALANGFVSDVNPDRSRKAAAACKLCIECIEKAVKPIAAPSPEPATRADGAKL